MEEKKEINKEEKDEFSQKVNNILAEEIETIKKHPIKTITQFLKQIIIYFIIISTIIYMFLQGQRCTLDTIEYKAEGVPTAYKYYLETQRLNINYNEKITCEWNYKNLFQTEGYTIKTNLSEETWWHK